MTPVLGTRTSSHEAQADSTEYSDGARLKVDLKRRSRVEAAPPAGATTCACAISAAKVSPATSLLVHNAADARNKQRGQQPAKQNLDPEKPHDEPGRCRLG